MCVRVVIIVVIGTIVQGLSAQGVLVNIYKLTYIAVLL